MLQKKREVLILEIYLLGTDVLTESSPEFLEWKSILTWIESWVARTLQLFLVQEENQSWYFSQIVTFSFL